MGAVRHEIDSTLVWRPGSAGTAEAFTTVDWCDPGQGGVAVADSFRLANGQVRGLEHHRARFLDGAARSAAPPAPARHDDGAEADAPARDAATFWRDAIAVLRDAATLSPHTPLFPRLERRERGEWRLLLRRSPAVASTASLATATTDPRRTPRTKGPDLERLAGLRTAAQAAGADEAVIVDARGRVIEGAYSSVIWSRGGELGVIADDAPRIPSVTERIVLEAARADGRRVVAARPSPSELAGAAVWVLSALHGARAVTGWVGGPEVTRDGALDRWLRAALHAAERPIAAS